MGQNIASGSNGPDHFNAQFQEELRPSADQIHWLPLFFSFFLFLFFPSLQGLCWWAVSDRRSNVLQSGLNMFILHTGAITFYTQVYKGPIIGSHGKPSFFIQRTQAGHTLKRISLLRRLFDDWWWKLLWLNTKAPLNNWDKGHFQSNVSHTPGGSMWLANMRGSIKENQDLCCFAFCIRYHTSTRK